MSTRPEDLTWDQVQRRFALVAMLEAQCRAHGKVLKLPPHLAAELRETVEAQYRFPEAWISAGPRTPS